MEMKKSDKPQCSSAFDPPVLIDDDGRYIQVSIDLPGVVEEQIRIDLEKNTFTLSVLNEGMTLRKAIQVPEGSRIFKKKFFNGVLTISLEKPGP